MASDFDDEPQTVAETLQPGDDAIIDALAEQPIGQEVAIAGATRFPWDPKIEGQYGELGVNKQSWRVLTDATYPSAKTLDAIFMVLAYCRTRKLDPFKKPCHIVPMWNSALGRDVETVWPGISELRTTAFRTGQYAGMEEPEFGEMIEKTFEGKVKEYGKLVDRRVTVRFPEWCRITVERVLAGKACRFVGPKVYWLESYATIGKSDIPNSMWQERPVGQIEKCTEAASLRRAFPEEIGSDYTADEMAGRVLGYIDSLKLRGPDEQATVINALAAREVAPARPEPAKRGRKPKAAPPPEPAHDPETGELAAGISPDQRPAQSEGSPQEAGRADPPGSGKEVVPAEQTNQTTETSPASDPSQGPGADLGEGDFSEPTIVDHFEKALATCKSYADVVEVGKAFRDRRHSLLQTGDARDNELGALMLVRYNARLAEFYDAEKSATALEASQKPQEARKDPEATQVAKTAETPSSKPETPANLSPATGAANPGWPDEVEQKIKLAGGDTRTVRDLCLYLWEAASEADVENRYAEIGPQYSTLKSSGERMAVLKARSFSALRFRQ